VKKNIFSVFIISILFPLFLYSNENEILSEITKDIKNIGKIATITKENKFYQPFIVSVFKGKDLERLGISNLKEALELIPGVDIATDNMDNKSAVFRGSNPFAYGQSKLIIDGIVVNDVMFDSYSTFLNMPINIIKRIEVVRGPGGKIDGVNAYAGSIYVVTYAERFDIDKSQDEIFLKTGSYKYKMGGFKKFYKSGDLKLFTDFYYQEDDKHLPTGYDSLNTGIYDLQPYFSNKHLTQKGEAPLWLKNYSLGISLDYKNLSLKARTMYYKKGSAYGINAMLPQDKDYVKLPSSYIEASYKSSIKNLETTVKFGVKWDDFYSETRAAPMGFKNLRLSNPDPNNPIIYKNGFYAINESRQRTFYQSTFFEYKNIDKHKIKFGYIVSKEETYEMVSKNTDRDDENNTNLVDYSDIYPFFDKDAKRYSYIFSIQDFFDYSEKLSFNYGVNIENNSHIDLQINPRITAVYKHNSDNIYKFMYSRSHRTPSWQELYTMNNKARVGNRELKPEIVNAFEAAYIKKFSIDSYIQTNIFYLINKDQINKINEDNQYRNAQDITIYGLELEYQGMITNRTKIYANYSFVYGKDDNDNELSNVANHMIKAFLTQELSPELDLNVIGKFVGTKKRIETDYRNDLKSYISFDLGLNYKNIKNRYMINFTVKNIFNNDIRYPSEPYTYDDDYKQEGRNYLISFSKEF